MQRSSSRFARLAVCFAGVVVTLPLAANAAVLYSASPPADIIFLDDSKVTLITLDGYALNQKGPEILVDQIDNPTPSKVTHTYSIEISRSYSKTVSASVLADASYIQSVFAEFGGIGASIETAVGAGAAGSMSESWSETITETKTETWCATCAKLSLYRYALYSEFWGTVEWYYDDPAPGFTFETLTWSARVENGTGTRISVDTIYTDEPCPEPGMALLVGMGLLAIALRRKRD